MTPTPTTLTSSWTSSDKLRQAVEVGLGTVRVAGGPLGGGDPEDELELFDKAAAIVTECKLRGLKVLFGFRIVEPGSYDEPRYYQKGRDWGN